MKKTCSYLLLSVFIFLSLSSYSQVKTTGRLAFGYVADEHTKLPVDGALISIHPAGWQTATDEQGKFFINILNVMFDTISITALGYDTRKIGYAEFLKGDKKIYLKNRIIEMKAVLVTLPSGDIYRPVSRLDIKLRDITNSQEVLRLVPGLFIGQHAGGGKAEQIFLRGFDIDHGTDVHLSVDGMPVNMVSHAHGQGYADLHFLIPELIENVSFKKGPYYADKGNMTTAGFVDFRIRKVLPANSVKLEAGQFNTIRAVGLSNLLSEKQKQKEQNAFVASEYMYTKGYFDHPQNFSRFNLFGKYYGRLNQNNMLHVSASAFSSKWKASGQIPERALQNGLIGFFGAIDPNEGGITHRTNFNAQVQTQAGNGNFIQNQVYYTYYDFELFSNFTFFLNNDVDGDQIKQKEKRELFGYRGSVTNISYIGGKKLNSEAGISIRLDKIKGSELSRTKDRGILIQPVMLGDTREINSSAWMNETLQWTKQFSINAGFRLDRFDVRYLNRLDNNKRSKVQASIVSPKLNFYYQVNDKTQLYLTTGKGFHSNDTRVVVQTAGRKILPAAYGADLGVVLKPSATLLVQAAVWYLKLDQEFVYVGDEGIVEPSGKSRRIGIDLSARYQPVKWLFIDADANYAHGRAVEENKGEDYLPLAPVLTSIGGITYKGKKGVNAALRYRFMSDRPANEDNSVVAKGYFVTDAAVSYERKKYEVGLSIQNLFDVRWKETQFNTESKLLNEITPVSEIHFTPGSPFFLKGHVTFFF